MDTRSPDSIAATTAAPATPSGPAVLADLVAAGLVSHEMIGDPARLADEAAALRALCARVAGPVWRIEPYHYAFRVEGAPEARAAQLEAALAAELGPEAAWVSATDRQGEAADLDRPLMLLRAQGEAAQGALEAAGPELTAVIGARFAGLAARLAAGAATDPAAGGALAARLAAIEERQAAILAALDAGATPDPLVGEALGRLAAALGQVAERLDAQAEALAAEAAARAAAEAARDDLLAGRLAEIAALAGAPAAFQETLGLALAEFLARIEGRIAAPIAARVEAPIAAARVPQAG